MTATTRRRRWPIALVVVLVLLAGLAVVADRIAVGRAEDRVATRLTGQNPFTGRPSVHIRRFPFLTQALRGVYSDIEVSGPGRGLGRLDRFQAHAHLHGVHVSLSDIPNRVTSVPVDRADVSVTASLAVLAAATGVPGLRLTPAGRNITARAPVDVPGLGRIPVTATISPSIQGGAIVGAVSAVQAAGIAVPPALQATAVQALGLRVVVSDLPFHAVATGVEVRGSDVVISGTATDVVLN